MYKRQGDTLLAATGRPYDTLEGVIGLDGKGKGTGTLMDYGVQSVSYTHLAAAHCSSVLSLRSCT